MLAEDAPRVVRPRQPPETRALGAETDLDRLEIELRQISAALHAYSIEQRRQGERWLEHSNRMRREIVALGAGRYRDQRAFSVPRGNLGAYGSEGNGSANLLHSLIVKELKKISRQRLGAHPSRVSPHYSVATQHHPRSGAE